MDNLVTKAYIFGQIGQTLGFYTFFILIGYQLLGKSFRDHKDTDKTVFGVFTVLGLFLALGNGFSGIIMMIELWICIGIKATFFPSGGKRNTD